jgi:hypothetical protein
MPKKDKDKKQAGQREKKGAEAADPLPQVWLPDQVNYVKTWIANPNVGGAELVAATELAWIP